MIIYQIFRKIMNDKETRIKDLKNQQREYQSSQFSKAFQDFHRHFSFIYIFPCQFLMCERSMLCSGFLCANDTPISSDIDSNYLICKCVFLSKSLSHVPKPYATLILWLTKKRIKVQMCSCTSCCFIEKQCERKEDKKCVDALVSNVASVHVTGFMPSLSFKPKKNQWFIAVNFCLAAMCWYPNVHLSMLSSISVNKLLWSIQVETISLRYHELSFVTTKKRNKSSSNHFEENKQDQRIWLKWTRKLNVQLICTYQEKVKEGILAYVIELSPEYVVWTLWNGSMNKLNNL